MVEPLIDLSRVYGLFSAGDYAEAHMAINKLIAQAPTSLNLYTNRAVIFRAMGRYNEAFEDYAKVIAQASPDTAKGREDLAAAYYNRGNLNEAVGKMEESLWDYDKCIELDPNYYEAYTGKAKVLVRTEEPDAAVKVLTKAMSIKPEDPAALVARGFIWLKEGRKRDARVDLENAWKMGRDQTHPSTRISWDIVQDVIIDLGGKADPKYNL